MQWRETLTARFPELAALPAGTYVVGGAIRDLLMNRTPADVDLACIDAAKCAATLNRKVIRLGREQLSAYRVVIGDRVYDFAELLDGNVDVDLQRRDFTVNAMALDLASDRLLDPNGGAADVRDGVVRMVRASNFDDDPLRTLKGVRMAVKYDMSLDEATVAAIRERAAKINVVAPERVTYELSIIFSSSRFRRALELLELTGLASALALRVREFHADDVSLAASLALLVDDPRAYGEQWRWSDLLLRDVLTLKRLRAAHGLMALYDAGESVARQLPAMLRADGVSDDVPMPDFTIAPLLDGAALTELTGVAPGPELGRIKRELLEAQVRGKVRTTSEAIAFVTTSR